jgi:hypothetical protein
VDIKKIVTTFVLAMVCCCYFCSDLFGMQHYGRWVEVGGGEITNFRARRIALQVVLNQLQPPHTAVVLPGNLSSVDANPTHGQVVYLSENEPYKNRPPNVTLSRRTMLNLLFDQPSDVVDLVYMVSYCRGLDLL